MNIKEAVNKIKIFLSENPIEETVEETVETVEEKVELVDVKTTDGIILSFDVLEVGADIFIVDEEGRVPATDAEYMLEDGSKIIVVEGKISEIVEPVETPEEAPVEETTEIPVEDVVEEMAEDPISGLIEKINKLEAENIEIKEILKALAENLSTTELKSEVKMEMNKKIDEKTSEKTSYQPMNYKSKFFDNLYGDK